MQDAPVAYVAVFRSRVHERARRRAGRQDQVEFTTQAEGDLLWSVEHAHQISLTLEGQAAVTQGISWERRGQSFEQVKKFSGTTRYSFAVERADWRPSPAARRRSFLNTSRRLKPRRKKFSSAAARPPRPDAT